jgi:hypothetical protein
VCVIDVNARTRKGNLFYKNTEVEHVEGHLVLVIWLFCLSLVMDGCGGLEFEWRNV